MARASVEDPLKSFRYKVVVDGFKRAGFSKVTGLKRTTDKAPYREGGMNDTEQKSAGLSHYPDITLTRGLIIGSSRGGDTDMDDWSAQVMSVAAGGNASNYRKDLDIELYNSLNVRAKVWTVYNCWPGEADPMPGLEGNKSENLLESLVLVNEGHDRTGP